MVKIAVFRDFHVTVINLKVPFYRSFARFRGNFRRVPNLHKSTKGAFEKFATNSDKKVIHSDFYYFYRHLYQFQFSQNFFRASSK